MIRFLHHTRDYDIVVDDTFGNPEHNRDFFDAYRAAFDKYKDLPLPIHEVNTAVLKLGDKTVIATNPAELFVEFGLQILKQSPFQYTMVVELTNGLIGYVATPEAFTHGGYEVRKIPGGSFMAVDTGDQIVTSWKEMLVKK